MKALADIKFPLRVEAGRCIVDSEGDKLFNIQRHESLSPTAADALCHKIVSLLNQEEIK